MRQGFPSLLILPILFSFLATAPVFAEEKTAAPLSAAGNSENSSTSASSAADVYRLLRNAGAEIDRVAYALKSKPANGAQKISFRTSPQGR